MVETDHKCGSDLERTAIVPKSRPVGCSHSHLQLVAPKLCGQTFRYLSSSKRNMLVVVEAAKTVATSAKRLEAVHQPRQKPNAHSNSKQCAGF
jgi:hypothetical protein